MRNLKWLTASALIITVIVGASFYLPSTPAANAAAGPEIFYTRLVAAAAVSSTRFLALNNTPSVAAFATSTLGILPIAGTFSNMTATVDNVPGGATSWIVTLDQNNASTGLTCTITSAATSCTTAGTFVASANRVYTIKFTASGAPAATYLRASIQFTPTTAGHTALFAVSTGNLNTGVQTFTPLNGNTNWSGTESQHQTIIPEAGTFQAIYADGVTAAGTAASGKKYDLFVRDAGADTSVTCTILETATGCSDTSHTSGAVSANDVVGLRALPTNTPTATALGFGVDFVPTTAGDFVFAGFSSTADDTSVTDYVPIVGNTISATEASTTMIAQAMTVTTLAVNVPTSPGATKTRTFTLRKNGSDTALTCLVNGATGHICSISGSVAYVAGDTIDISDSSTSTPAASTFNSWSIVANTNTAPPAATDDGSSNWFNVL